MVSEGVDVPRLRVGVYATNTITDLFFRQAVVNAIQFLTGQNLWDPSVRFLSELPSKTDPVQVLRYE